MKLLKLLIILLTMVLFSCEDSLNGPVDSDLSYEPQLLSIGKAVEFGTINNDLIKVTLVGLDGNSYIFEHSNNVSEHCPLNADEMRLSFIMCDDKYKVTFIYNTVSANNIRLQVYKYERI